MEQGQERHGGRKDWISAGSGTKEGEVRPPVKKRHGGGVKEGPGASETCLLREGDWEWGTGLQRVDEVARGHGGERALPAAPSR